jgi:hypothetical protein
LVIAWVAARELVSIPAGARWARAALVPIVLIHGVLVHGVLDPSDAALIFPCGDR